MLKADAYQLGVVAWADPNRKPAFIDRLQPEIADAGAQKTDPVLVGIEARKRLGEGLADTVAAVRARHHAMVDHLVARIKADRMVARGHDDAFDPGSSRCLEQVVCAADVRLKDRLPAALARDTSQMYDAINVGDDAFDCGQVGKLGVIDLLSGSRCRERDTIGESQDRIDTLQSLAQ